MGSVMEWGRLCWLLLLLALLAVTVMAGDPARDTDGDGLRDHIDDIDDDNDGIFDEDDEDDDGDGVLDIQDPDWFPHNEM